MYGDNMSVLLFIFVCRINRCVGRKKRLDDLFYAFLKFWSGHHDLVSASKAFDPEIGAGSHDFPLFAPAWVLFSEFNYISQTVPVRHLHAPPFHLLRQPVRMAAGTIHVSSF